MQCQTIKKNKECIFWGKAGCKQDAGECQSIAEKCEGCSRLEQWPNGSYCSVYAEPAKQWLLGLCNMATHIKLESQETQKMLNPLKASKRGVGRR